jgi:hypothetical protein
MFVIANWEQTESIDSQRNHHLNQFQNELLAEFFIRIQQRQNMSI